MFDQLLLLAWSMLPLPIVLMLLLLLLLVIECAHKSFCTLVIRNCFFFSCKLHVYAYQAPYKQCNCFDLAGNKWAAFLFFIFWSPFSLFFSFWTIQWLGKLWKWYIKIIYWSVKCPLSPSFLFCFQQWMKFIPRRRCQPSQLSFCNAFSLLFLETPESE